MTTDLKTKLSIFAFALLVVVLSIVGPLLYNHKVVQAQGPSVVFDEPFFCIMTSTAVTITEITNCAVMNTGRKRFITDIIWSSSIISTTVNFMLIEAGTGAVCVTNKHTMYSGFIPAGFGSVVVSPLRTPVPAGVNEALCFTHPGAGTRNIFISGFIR